MFANIGIDCKRHINFADRPKGSVSVFYLKIHNNFIYIMLKKV